MEQKERYDAKHNTKTNIKVGDDVLLRVMKNTHRMAGKLDIRWTGLYEVVEDCGKMRYKFKAKNIEKGLKQTVHCCKLKNTSFQLVKLVIYNDCTNYKH